MSDLTEICPRFTPGPWKFTGACDWERCGDRSCGYCGSMHPGDLMARLEAGDVALGATDKNYKAYVVNAGGAPLLQTYRNCPPGAGCTGPEDCAHWTTREVSQRKFYFQHLSEAQMARFVELYNAGRVRFEGGIGFYRWPYFMGPKR